MSAFVSVPVTVKGPAGSFIGQKSQKRGGPGSPPAGFVTPTTSAEEWIAYWGLAKVMQDPDTDHVRLPPFFGGLDWGYQIGDRIIGSAVVDFVIYLPGEIVGVRLQTEYFHGAAGPEKNASDETQLLNLSSWMTIKDLFSLDFIGDTSGEAVVTAWIDLLGGRARLPLSVRNRRTRIGTF